MTDAGLVVDTSAVIALLTRERGHEQLESFLDAASSLVMCPATVVEIGIVMEARNGAEGRWALDRLVTDLQIEVIPLDADRARTALDGWRLFGKGRHAASLSLGDCFTYALAVATGYPVLCTGNGFVRTDVEVRRPD